MMVKSSVLLVYLIVTGDIAMSKSFPLMNIKILPYMVVILLVLPQCLYLWPSKTKRSSRKTASSPATYNISLLLKT